MYCFFRKAVHQIDAGFVIVLLLAENVPNRCAKSPGLALLAQATIAFRFSTRFPNDLGAYGLQMTTDHQP